MPNSERAREHAAFRERARSIPFLSIGVLFCLLTAALPATADNNPQQTQQALQKAQGLLKDYGRIKAVSRRLRVRESDVFRFLVKVGLAEVSALCRSDASTQELLGAFAAHGAELVSHFKLNAQQLGHVINGDPRSIGAQVDTDDLELIAMSSLPERYLALRLQELIGRPVTPDAVHQVLQNYLEGKYLSAGAT